MPASLSRSLAIMLAPSLLALLPATPALAQPGWGGWGPGWGTGPSRWGSSSMPARDDREGKVSAERFLAEGAAPQLGKGAIVVRTMPGTTAEGREQATYEAAIIDQLAKAGYDTAQPEGVGGQIVELTLTHDELEPAEEKKSPWSGSATMGVSNRGSMMAVSVGYDATKPRGALINTTLQVRIRDRATGAALYEGRATIATREGTKASSDTALSTKLAGALFDHFPSSTPPER